MKNKIFRKSLAFVLALAVIMSAMSCLMFVSVSAAQNYDNLTKLYDFEDGSAADFIQVGGKTGNETAEGYESWNYDPEVAWVSALEKYIDILDMVLIMTVEPGFGGQKFIDFCLPKIAEARALIDARNPKCLLEIDGGVTCDNVAAAKAAGANVIVAGSSVFGAEDMKRAIEILGE